MILRGENSSGKSSVLNGIESAINGSAQLACPIRERQLEGSVALDIANKTLSEQLTVERRFWRATDKTGAKMIRNKLDVIWKAGGSGPRLSPQATMDALAGDSSFDRRSSAWQKMIKHGFRRASSGCAVGRGT